MSALSDVVAEEEANYFALLLLMPETAFEAAMKIPLDLFDEKGLSAVAKMFQVNVPMVVARAKLLERKRKGR